MGDQVAGAAETHLTFGMLAARLGVVRYRLEALADRGLIPFVRAGRIRVVPASELPGIRKALVEAGYMSPGHTGA